MSGSEPTEEQRAATEKLDAAIQDCWRAYGRSGDSWERTAPDDRMVNEWAVLVGVMGDDESQVDFLLPHFPAIPMHHLKGLLAEGADQLRGDEP